LTKSRGQNITEAMELFAAGVPQEHPMGCAVACVAFRCAISYPAALAAFSTHEHAWTRGFYCEEVVEALANLGLKYSFDHYESKKHGEFLTVPGTIIFVNPFEQYPSGHFLVRGLNSWMNPWSTFPNMNPVRAEFQESLPGRIGYVLFENISLL
jgi:hypothetical protein